MARTKGSKNKTVNDKIDGMIAQIQSLPVDPEEKQEAIDELEDLLDNPEVKEPPKDSEGKKFIGYHPITGKEIFE